MLLFTSVPSLKSLEFRRRSVGCFSRRERSAHICVIRVERATQLPAHFQRNDITIICARRYTSSAGLVASSRRSVKIVTESRHKSGRWLSQFNVPNIKVAKRKNRK